MTAARTLLISKFMELLQKLQSPLYRNSLYVLGATGISAVSGFVFWIIAAQNTSPADVGVTQGALAAATLLKSIGDFGLSFSVIYYASSKQENAGPLINTVISAGWLISFATSLTFILLIIPTFSDGLIIIREDAYLFVAFALFTAVDAILALQDAAMLSQKRGDYVFWRNMACNIPPIFIVLILTQFSQDVRALFIAYTIPNMIVGIIIGKYVLPRQFEGYRFFGKFDLSVMKRIASYGIANHMGNLLWGIPSYVLPIIAVNVLLPDLSGYFNTNWLLFTFLLIIPRSVTLSMFVEGSSDMEQLLPIAVRSMGMILILSFPITVFLWFFGEFVLSIFGEDYATVDTLHILLLSVVPFAINSVFFVMLRVQKQLTLLVFYSGFVAGGVVFFIWLLADPTAMEGIATGWLIGHSIPAALITLWVVYAWFTREKTQPIEAPSSPASDASTPSPAVAD